MEIIKCIIVEGIVQKATLEPGRVVAVKSATSCGLFSEPTRKNTLLLLRALLVTGGVLFALGQKPFRNYGGKAGSQPGL